MPSPQVHIAVLIDADNTSYTHASDLLEELARYGVPTVKRAYGDWSSSHVSGWKAELNKHAIQPIQQFAYTTGKNATDFALVIDAMDLLYADNLDAFAIVSSDSDFTRLVTRLRESGKTVYGLGRRRTPASLVAACDKFIFTEVLASGGDSAQDDPGEDGAPLPDLQRILTAAIEASSLEDGWAHLGAVGNHISNRFASFDPRNYGYARLITLARAQPYVEVQQAASNVTRVRLAPTEPAVKQAGRKQSGKRAAAKKATGKSSAN